MSKSGVYHRDLKCDNILIHPNTLVIKVLLTSFGGPVLLHMVDVAFPISDS